MDKTSNIFSYCVGGLALVSAIISTALYYNTYLPGAQMKILDALLEETKDIFAKAEADGLIPTDSFRIAMQRRLATLERSSSPLRERTYRATTMFQEYRALLQGLSREIMQKSHDAKKLRAIIFTTSEEQRRRQSSVQTSEDVRLTTDPTQDVYPAAYTEHHSPPHSHPTEDLDCGTTPIDLSRSSTECTLSSLDATPTTTTGNNQALSSTSMTANISSSWISRFWHTRITKMKSTPAGTTDKDATVDVSPV